MTALATATARSVPSVSICLVVCYFGVLPRYMDCVLRSCAANADIDWLLLTDDATPWRYPDNVRVVPTTLANLRARFSERLGYQVAIDRPHKLCDFKVAYGHLLANELAGYDFWGHCDLDVIFGDLRRMLGPELLAAYDRLLVHGHLSLYRNREDVNRWFEMEAPGVPSARTVYTDPAGYAFDEWEGFHAILRYHGIPQYQERILADIPLPTRWRYTRFEGLGIPNHPFQIFYWYRGGIYQAWLNQDRGNSGTFVGIVDRELAYVHFRRSLPAPAFDPFEVDGFLITPDGFVPYGRERLDERDFTRLNRARLRPIREIARELAAGVRRRLRRLRARAQSRLRLARGAAGPREPR